MATILENLKLRPLVVGIVHTAQPFLGRLNIVGKQINEHRAMLDAAPS